MFADFGNATIGGRPAAEVIGDGTVFGKIRLRYEFEGLENLSAGQVRDTIGLAQNAPLDPEGILRDEWVNARGAIVGLTRGSGRAHIVRAALDSGSARELLERYADRVKTGVPGVAMVRVDGQAKWPESLQVKLPE